MAWIQCVLLFSAFSLVFGQEEGEKCERIKLPLCQDLGYNWTAMPNLIGHRDQKEAEEAMSAFEGILSSGCSVHARFVLCSAFVPLCSEQVSGSVSACRALCEAVVADCRDQAAKLNLTVALDCQAFPVRADRRMCMRPPNASEPEPPPPPRQPLWPPELTLRENGEHGCPPAHARSPAGHCWPACGQHAHVSATEKRRVEFWMTVLAWTSLASTTFALLTFIADPARYRYPERAGVWVAACQWAVALAHVARGWLGARAISCAGSTLAVEGLAAPGCVAWFTITQYGGVAADAWLACAGVAWYLAAASEWSTEALERAAVYLHAAAWGWAGAWTASTLALRRVHADELSGTCEAAAALAAVARGAALGAAAALGVGAALGVMRLRRALGGRGAKRVGAAAGRAALLGSVYLIVSGLSAAARLWGGGAWWLWLRLAAGAWSGSWAWTGKSLRVWRRILCGWDRDTSTTTQPTHKVPHYLAPPLLRPQHPYYKRPLHVSRV